MEEIYKQYAKQIYHFLLYLSRNSDLAEELTQETFYKAIQHIHQFRGDCEINVWLCQIAKNLYYMHIRHQYKTKTIPIEELEKSEKIELSMEEELFCQEDKIWLYNKVQELEPSVRKIVVLRIVSELSFKQIAYILNKSETYVRVNFYRAKKKLIKANREEKENEK
ncbi:MAG: RNA polymerase sigma factor [Clostridia bacterium]